MKSMGILSTFLILIGFFLTSCDKEQNQEVTAKAAHFHQEEMQGSEHASTDCDQLKNELNLDFENASELDDEATLKFKNKGCSIPKRSL